VCPAGGGSTRGLHGQKEGRDAPDDGRPQTGARKGGEGWCPLLSNGWGAFGYYAVPVFAHSLHRFLLLLLLLL